MIEIRRLFRPDALISLDTLSGVVFRREAEAHRFLIAGPAPFTGEVTACFRRADGITLVETGSLTAAGEAAVTLTDDCYQVAGRLLITIYVTDGGVKTCVYAGQATVFDETGRPADEIVDGGTMDTVEAMLAALMQDMEEAADLARRAETAAADTLNLPAVASSDVRIPITATMQGRWINGSREVYESAYYLLSDVLNVDEYTVLIPDSGYQVGALYYAAADDGLGAYTGATGFRTDCVILQPGKYYAVVFATQGVSARVDQGDLIHLEIRYGYGKPAYSSFTSDTASRHSMGRIQRAGVYFFTNAELRAFPRTNELPSDIGSANAILVNTPYVYNGSRFTYQQLLTITDPIRAYTRYCYNGSVYQNWKAVPNASQMAGAIETAAGEAVTTAAANAQAAINTSVYAGKTLSIYGDSISTFQGWIPEGNATWYYTTGNGMPNGVEDAYWKKLLGALGMTLMVNNSWSGRRVSGSEANAGWKAANIAQLASGGTVPDVILIEMGTNDFNAGPSWAPTTARPPCRRPRRTS